MINTLGTDVMYSFVIIFISSMIYFATRELYELSQHKGIQYFRLAFLFFAIAYAFRFITQFLVISLGIPRPWNTNLSTIHLLFPTLFIYASTVAIFYLWASGNTHWLNKKHSTVLLHAIAIVITLLAIYTQNIVLLLIIQVALIALLAFSSYKKRTKKKSLLELHLLYTLIAIFWALNLLDILVPSFLFQTQIIIYLASISLFLILFYKVIKKI